MKTLNAALIALAVAIAVLVVAVLPAEYGIDPLGTGRALGLTALAGVDETATPATANAQTPAPVPASLSQDTYIVELRPFEGVEYKYRLEQGRGLVFEWSSTAAVEWDFHGEPDGAPAKFSESYEKGNSRGTSGVFVAQKPGIHGWFWENQGEGRITVTLKTSGFYLTSTEYRDGDLVKRTFGK